MEYARIIPHPVESIPPLVLGECPSHPSLDLPTTKLKWRHKTGHREYILIPLPHGGYYYVQLPEWDKLHMWLRNDEGKWEPCFIKGSQANVETSFALPSLDMDDTFEVLYRSTVHVNGQSETIEEHLDFSSHVTLRLPGGDGYPILPPPKRTMETVIQMYTFNTLIPWTEMPNEKYHSFMSTVNHIYD